MPPRSIAVDQSGDAVTNADRLRTELVFTVAQPGGRHRVGDETALPRTRDSTELTVSSSRWTPSAMSSTTASDSAAAPSAASAAPGERWWTGAIPLNRWVTSPGGCARRNARVVAASASVWPTAAPRCSRQLLGQGVGARELRRDRHLAHVTAAGGDELRGQAEVGRHSHAGSWAPHARDREERTLDVDAGKLAGLDAVRKGGDGLQHLLGRVGHGAADQRGRAVSEVVGGSRPTWSGSPEVKDAPPPP